MTQMKADRKRQMLCAFQPDFASSLPGSAFASRISASQKRRCPLSEGSAFRFLQHFDSSAIEAGIRYTKNRKELHFSIRQNGLIVEARLSLGCSQAKTWRET
jgi:hypothetical protein